MSEIEQFNSMTQNITKKITEFKNKEITKNDLNKYMLVNMSYILASTMKMKQKNKLINEKQYSATIKCISKIKTYHGNINFKPIELEINPIMKKLLNPTLESYIPFSELAYTTEKQFYNIYSNKKRLKINTSSQKEEMEDITKEINYFETPINFMTKKKLIKSKNSENNLLNLLNESDDLLFLSSNDDEISRNLFLDNLVYSFDENNKEDPYYDDKDIFGKKIETSAFFTEEKQIKKKKSAKEFSGNVNLTLYNISTSCSSSRGSNGGSVEPGNCGDNIISNEIYEFEFKDFLSIKTFNKFSEEMSLDYIRYLLLLYKNTMYSAIKNFFCEEKTFLYLSKSFLLKIGLTNKKYYEDIISNLNFNKMVNSNFEIFIKSFSKILKYKDENQIHKYKLLLYLLKLGDEEEINIKHINYFLQLIKGKCIYDEEICENITHNFINKYNRIYREEASINFNFRKILIILESFFK